MARYDVDLLVIGGGAAGLTAAGTAANLGAKTMMVERHRLGGDCTWTGCVPSKTLLHVAHLRASTAAYLHRYSAVEDEVASTVAFSRVRQALDQIREEVYEDADAPHNFTRFGVEVVQGEARFVSPHAVDVQANGEVRTVSFRLAVVCSGGRAAPPPVEGLDRVPFLTNESLFELTALPRRLVILGAGSIGVEMGQAFRRLGSDVVVVDRATRVLGRDDAENAEILRGALEDEGVRFVLGATVRQAEATGDGVRLLLDVNGESRAVEGSHLLVATGRRPNLEGLSLDAAGVDYTDRGITVDDRCRTSASHIFAAGDCTGEYQLTHMSEHMAKVAVSNAVLKVPMSIDRRGVPWTTFTSPEVAQVGRTSKELEEAETSFVT